MDKYELPEERLDTVNKKIKNLKLRTKNLNKLFLKKKEEILYLKNKQNLFGNKNREESGDLMEKNFLYAKAKKKLYESKNYTMSISTELDRNSKTMKNTLNNTGSINRELSYSSHILNSIEKLRKKQKFYFYFVVVLMILVVLLGSYHFLFK